MHKLKAVNWRTLFLPRTNSLQISVPSTYPCAAPARAAAGRGNSARREEAAQDFLLFTKIFIRCYILYPIFYKYSQIIDSVYTQQTYSLITSITALLIVSQISDNESRSNILTLRTTPSDCECTNNNTTCTTCTTRTYKLKYIVDFGSFCLPSVGVKSQKNTKLQSNQFQLHLYKQ